MVPFSQRSSIKAERHLGYDYLGLQPIKSYTPCHLDVKQHAMNSPPDAFYQELTQGVSIIEIDEAIQKPQARPRRDSQVGSSYAYAEALDHPSAIFDGPGSYNVPSSVSNMYHEGHAGGRMRRMSRESSRRLSRDSIPRRLSVESGPRRTSEDALVTDDEEIVGDAPPYVGSSPEPVASTSVFENIATFFGRQAPSDQRGRSQQPSISRRSSKYSSRSSLSSRQSLDRHSREFLSDSEERWGYSSAEEESLSSRVSDEGDKLSYSSSRPPSRTDDLPLLSRDPMFGDTYADNDQILEDFLPPPPPGLPSRQ